VAAGMTVDGSPALTGGADSQSFGVESKLEVFKKRYYLATIEDRIGVLEEIRERGTSECLQFIVSLLKYPDLEVRREAAHVLKKWDNKGRMALFEGMEDPEIYRQCESIFMEIGARALPFLTEMLKDPDPGFRSRAAYLMGIIGDPTAVGPLYSRLQDPDRNVRIQIIQALCCLGDERSLEGILGLFETADLALADFVMRAAERFGPKAAVPLRAALQSGSVRVRSRAALALGRLRLEESLPDLYAALQDQDPAVRRSVVKALDSYHDMSSLEGLLSALRDPDLLVQDYATTALANLHPDSYPYVRGGIRDPDPLVRKNAVIAMRKMGDERAVPEIIAALGDPDPDVRMFAVTALIQFKDPRAIRPLINRLKQDEEIGWLASFAFMEIGGESVDELLLATGDDSFCLTRNLIILQMGDRALETLHRRALRGETMVRYNAIALLGELGRPESVPVLANLLQYGEVGWVSAHALAEIGHAAWGSILDATRKGGIARENALESIRYIKDPELNLELIQHLSDHDRQFREALAEPLIQAGSEVVLLIVEKMRYLNEDCFSNAAEILCRMDDQRAVKPLIRVLFPEPGTPGSLEEDQLFNLRRAYLSKGDLEPVVARLKKEEFVASEGEKP
jgi:HEAT repeat protein